MILQTSQDVASDIRMQRQTWAGSFLLVEGRDDKRFMDPFVDPVSCQIQVAQGKEIVCDVLRILNGWGFQGVLGLVDADFDRVRQLNHSRPGVVMLEHHDLETMLFSSPALDRVLAEFGNQTKIQDLGEDPLEALMEQVLPLARLRLASAERGLGLRFSNLRYSNWLNRHSFNVDVEKMIVDVRNKSSRHDLSVEELRSAIEDVETAKHDSLEICNGHDLVEILAIALTSKMGSNSSKPVSADELRRSLRLAYSEQEFTTSRLRGQVREWEDRSQGFRIIKDTI